MPKSISTLYIYTPIVGAALLASTLGHPADANAFTGDPIFSEVSQYSTTIGDDPTDIYFPIVSDPLASLPVALMFQGSMVDKADYSNYASIVASYGFAVVVPNNERTLVGPTGPVTGLLAEQGQVQQVLDFVALENQTPTSPLNNLLDPDALGLLGHSFGGAVGLASVQGICIFPFCTDSYRVPAALKAGIFYGTSFDLDPGPGVSVPPINNVVPTGYILGNREGVVDLPVAVETFQQTLNPPKVLVEVDGANHYGITNEDSFRDPVRPTLDQAIATETIGRWSGLFLRAHVLDDQDAFDYVYNFGDALDPVVTTQSVEAVKTPEPSAALGGLLLVAALAGRRLLKRRGGE
ncbi:MAG: chlorophyllase [Cyanobacteria bacterium J06639_16]